MELKKRTFRIIQPHTKNDIPSAIYDWFIFVLVVVDMITTILATVSSFSRFETAFIVIEIITVIVFAIEYILRFWTADLFRRKENPLKARLKYAFSFIMIVDLMAIAPFFLQFVFPVNIHILRTFRLLRIFRLLRVRKYVKTLSQFHDILKQKASQLFFSMIILFVLMLVASTLMYTAENEAQPEVFDNAMSGLWWAIITMTTIGYGDIYPITAGGKVIGALFSLLSVAIIAVPTGIISAGFIESNYLHKKIASNTNKKSKPFCPYCGENLDE
ncbi:MAG: potassium channel family protein [Oscillospiraceae bacterium]|nr:potassium channel family protein [Oscillospiraceae bacterium]